MGISSKLSTETFRFFEKFGGNEAVPESIQRPPTAVKRNNNQRMEPFAWIAAIPAAFIGALFVNSLRWIFKLPTDAILSTWEVNEADPKDVESLIEDESEAKKTPSDNSNVQVASKKKTKAGYGFGDRKRHYVFGFPGLLIGLPLAVASGLFVALVFRMPKNVIISAYQAALLALELAASETLSNFTGFNRHWFLKLLGSPGILVGLTLASPVVAVILVVRLLRHGWKFPYHSILSFVSTIQTILKAVSPEDSKFNVELQNAQERNFFQRFILGGIGAISGAFVGVALASPIIAIRFITNTLKVFYHNTKVLINWGFQRHVFNDSYLDNISSRNANFKLGSLATFRSNAANLKFGFLGLPLAFLISGTAAVLIRGGRIFLPIFLGAVFAGPSIIRRGGDEIRKFFTGQRLDPANKGNIDDVDFEVHRRIFANIKPWSGRPDVNLPLTPREPGVSELGGGFIINLFTLRNWSKFVRKIFTFNGQTLEEEFLSKMYNNLSESFEAAQTRINSKRNEIQDQVTELSEKNAELEEEITKIRLGNSGLRKALQLPRLISKQVKINNLITGLNEENRLLDAESAARNSVDAPDVKTDKLIDLSVNQMKHSYKDQSSITMSDVEKAANDSTLDNLGAFVKDKLKERRKQVLVANSNKADDPPPYIPSEYPEPVYAELPNFFFKYKEPSAPPAGDGKESKQDANYGLSTSG